MAQRDRATVDVHFGWVQLEVTDTGDRLGGEGLVELILMIACSSGSEGDFAPPPETPSSVPVEVSSADAAPAEQIAVLYLSDRSQGLLLCACLPPEPVPLEYGRRRYEAGRPPALPVGTGGRAVEGARLESV
jgi:hypothetical protein